MVNEVQIGITNRCHSHCYFCFREEIIRENKFTQMDMPLEIAKKVIDTDSVEDIQFCGNMGESLHHPDINEILDYATFKGKRIGLNTNGDRFDTEWWKNFAKKNIWNENKVIFALDGLKKEHEYYRGTKWINVFNNMKAFIEGGGNAVWQIILFEHNQNQVNLIKGIAKKIGCSETWIINSRIYNRKYKRPNIKTNETKREILLKYEKNLRCKFEKGRKVYVGVDGEVWPCCHTRCHYHPFWKWKKHPVIEFYNKEKDFINLKNNDLNYIVENSEMFKFVFENMYEYNPKKEPDRQILPCYIFCNTQIEKKKNRRKIIN